jgi:hypothetical protein
MTARALILVVTLVFLSSCGITSTPFNVSVSGRALLPHQPGVSYIVLPLEQDVAENSLEFQEYKRYLDRALAAKDFVQAADTSSADIALLFGYGIGDPQTRNYSYSLPVFGQTGVSGSTTTGTISTYGSNSTFSGTTTYTPTYGITGYNNISGSTSVYTRHFTVTAYDWQTYLATQEEIVLWQTAVVSTGFSGDLRRVMPIIIAAGQAYLGDDTGQAVSLTLYETDDDVIRIKGEDIN